MIREHSLFIYAEKYLLAEKIKENRLLGVMSVTWGITKQFL